MDFANYVAELVASLWNLGSFLVAIVVIVTVHEFGHYIVGRWTGIQAEVFSLGFGRRLYAWTDKRGTRWQIAALPLGGFVRFKGDRDAASTPDQGAQKGLSAAETRQTMAGAPLWARAATVVAGPLANFVLAFVLFAAVILWKGVAVDIPTIGALKTVPFATPHLQLGDTITAMEGQATPDLATFLSVADTLSDKPVVRYQVSRLDQAVSLDGPNPFPAYAASIQSPSAAEDAGLRVGDVILKAAGQDIASFSQMPKVIEASGGASVDLTVWRAGEVLNVALTPRSRDLPTADGGFETRWLIGVTGGMIFDPLVRRPSVTEAAGLAWQQGWYMAKVNLSGLGYMIAGKISTCNVSSPIGIAKAVGAAARSGWESFLQTLALVSLSIGLLNLFPIPVLDGGHLVFYAYEAVTGRPPNARAHQILMMVGVGLLGALMLFAVFNDVIGCI